MNTAWGPWRLDPDQQILYITQPVYDIDLKQCVAKVGLLGWISHMASKTWMTDAHLAGLVRALNDLFYPHWSASDRVDALASCIARAANEPSLARFIQPFVEPSTEEPQSKHSKGDIPS